jgi:hypothetical protein
VPVELDYCIPLSMGVAELDDAKAAMAAGTIAEDKRIVTRE